MPSSHDHDLLGAITLLENRNLSDPAEIEKAIKMGEYIRNGESLSVCVALKP